MNTDSQNRSVRLLHPRIVTGPEGESTDALLIVDGTIAAVGDDARDATVDEEIRPEGEIVMSAMHDAHIHMWGLGMRAGSCGIRVASSVEEVYELLQVWDPAESPSGWLLARDWDENRWPVGQSLSRERLDELYPDIPVALWRVDSHAIWANTAAIRRAGIEESWRPGAGGSVGVADGRLTGLFVDDAMYTLLDAVPKPSVGEDREVFLQSAKLLRDLGVCGAQLAWVPVDRVDFLRQLEADGELPLHTSVWVDGKDDDIEAFVDAGPQFGDQLTIHTVKFFVDGAMGSRGALMLEPFLGGEKGLVVTEREVLIDRVRRYTEAGWDIAVHAIGDLGARNVLDAFDAAAPGARLRLEHAQIMAAEDIARMADGDRVASVQPIHLYSDAPWAHEALAEHQLERLFNWRDLHDVATVVAGSDFPIDDPNPWHGLATFLTRRHARGEVFRAEQALTREESIAAYTTRAAEVSRWSHLGRLEPGYTAEWIAIDTDPWHADPDEIWDTVVLESAYTR